MSAKAKKSFHGGVAVSCVVWDAVYCILLDFVLLLSVPNIRKF